MSTAADRQVLVDNLLDAVKQCQIRFGGRAELATDFDERVSILLDCLETVFTHGLKKNRNLIDLTKQVVSRGLPKSVSANLGTIASAEPNIFFWHFVRCHLNKHEYERYLFLKNVHTDFGRGRSWLRSTLNERSLERYVLMMLGDGQEIRSQFYEDWAFLLDEERNSVLPTMARGLSSILFAVNIDNSELDSIQNKHSKAIDINQETDPLPVIVASSANTNAKGNIRTTKKPPKVNIISLCDDKDEDDDDDDIKYAHSAPSTLTSPDLETNFSNHLSDGSQNDLSPGIESEQINNNLQVVDFVGGVLESKVLLTPINENFNSFNSNVEDDSSDKLSLNDQVDVNKIIDLSDDQVCQSGDEFLLSTQLVKEINNSVVNEDLQAEMENLKLQNEEIVAKYESQIDSLKKENGLLKMQLKKYIAAIQMLGHEDQSFDVISETSDQLLQSVSVKRTDHSPSSYIYYYEVNEYEKKLVQVAEMHGELVEFNDHLHRVIQQKEAIINRLREELIELRGPLPDDNQPIDDNLSITSECDNSIASQANRRLINIWVPTAFLAGGQKNKSHHVYQIYIRIKDEEWNVYRRYSQFYALHKSLRKKFPSINSFEFPPKKTLGNRDSKVVQERRKKLEQYLRSLVNLLQTKFKDLNNKEHLITVLPFLSEKFVQADGRSHSDTQLNKQNNSSDSRHYIGL